MNEVTSSNNMAIDLRLPKLITNYKPPVNLELLRFKQNLKELDLPGVEAVGAGYNIYGEYASAASIYFQFFDWSKAKKKEVSFKPEYMVPEIIDVQQQDTSNYIEISGSSITEFQSSFSSCLKISGAKNLFSGSISEEFSYYEARKAENEFSRIQQSIQLWSLVIRPDYQELRKLLHNHIQQRIDSAKTDKEFDDLFDNYGSHFLTGIIMGGRAVLSSSTNKVRVNRKFTNEVTARATYNSLTGQLSAEAKAKYAESIVSFDHNSVFKKFVRGGDGVTAHKVFSGNEDNFNKWINSVGSSPDFIAFMRENPVAGIWNLCETSVQKSEMQEYFEKTWGPRKSREAQINADYIDKLVVILGKKEPPAGYTKVPYDLNKGAGGELIYLCYHKATVDALASQNPECIINIKFVTGKNASPPAGYEKINVDLNKGAGGKFIYLCYQNAKHNNDKAIKDVTIIGGKEPNPPPPYDFIRVDQDLNQGARGEYIYLCYSIKA